MVGTLKQCYLRIDLLVAPQEVTGGTHATLPSHPIQPRARGSRIWMAVQGPHLRPGTIRVGQLQQPAAQVEGQVGQHAIRWMGLCLQDFRLFDLC